MSRADTLPVAQAHPPLAGHVPVAEMHVGMNQGRSRLVMQRQRFHRRRPDFGAAAGDVRRNYRFGFDHRLLVALMQPHPLAGAEEILKSEYPFQVRTEARSSVVLAVHFGESVDYLFGLRTGNRRIPTAEFS